MYNHKYTTVIVHVTHDHYLHTTVPIPSVSVSILNNQTVGQSLTLECNVIAVRGITSIVDIVWSSNDTELNIIKRVNISSVTNNSVLYTDAYVIQQLRTTDENREYQCEIFIDTESPITAKDNAILNVTGKHMYYYTLYFLHSSNIKLLL